MKRSPATTVLALVLLFTLTACAKTDQQGNPIGAYKRNSFLGLWLLVGVVVAGVLLIAGAKFYARRRGQS